MDRNTYLIMAGVSAISLGIGGYGGYFIANRRLRGMYDKMVRDDISATRDYYQRRYKEGKYATPEKAAAKLIPADLSSPEPEEDVRLKPAVDALLEYSPTLEGLEVAETDEEAERLQQEHEAKMRNIFHNGQKQEPWNQELELENRAAEPGRPYILTQDEYMASETEFEQSTITYYQGDDVLCDSRDAEIRDSDDVVGDVNLTKFGHGSGDPNVLYVRNEKLEMEFEILLERSTYVKEVLGFTEAPERAEIRKFRNGRDE